MNRLGGLARATRDSIDFLTLSGGHRGRREVAHFTARWQDWDRREREDPARAKEPLTWIVWASTLDLDGKLQRLAWLLAGTFGLTTLVSAVVLAGRDPAESAPDGRAGRAHSGHRQG